jgi:hypothetical protein
MAVNVMILAIAFLSLFQSEDRKAIAALYALGLLVHVLLFDGLDDGYYFIVAGMTDYAIICLMAVTFKRSAPLKDDIMLICLISVMVNFAGLVLWFFYVDPALYNSIFMAIYGAAIIVLMKGDCYGGRGAIDTWRRAFSISDNSCRFDTSKSSTEKKA